MSNGPSSAPVPALDPVLAAFDNAPPDDRPESEAEGRAVAEAKAHAAVGGRWFSGDEVSAAIAARRLDVLLKK